MSLHFCPSMSHVTKPCVACRIYEMPMSPSQFWGSMAIPVLLLHTSNQCIHQFEILRIEHGMAKVSQEESQESKREFSEVPILSYIGSLTFCQLMKRLPMQIGIIVVKVDGSMFSVPLMRCTTKGHMECSHTIPLKSTT